MSEDKVRQDLNPQKLTDEEVRELVRRFNNHNRNKGRGKVNKDNQGKNPKHVEEVKEEKSKKERRVFGVRVIETRYGKRVLIEQGANRVWLREADLVQLLTVLVREALGIKEEEQG